MHTLKHKLKHYLLRLVAVPTSVLIWSAENTFHLLNRFMLSTTAIYIVITTHNARNCNFFQKKITSTTIGKGIHRAVLATQCPPPLPSPGLMIFLRLWPGLLQLGRPTARSHRPHSTFYSEFRMLPLGWSRRQVGVNTSRAPVLRELE